MKRRIMTYEEGEIEGGGGESRLRGGDGSSRSRKKCKGKEKGV